jgi:hypothetical protein
MGKVAHQGGTGKLRQDDPDIKHFLSVRGLLKEGDGRVMSDPDTKAAYVAQQRFYRPPKLGNLNDKLYRYAWLQTERQAYQYIGNSPVSTVDETIATMDMTKSCGFPHLKRWHTKQMYVDSAEGREELETTWVKRLLNGTAVTFAQVTVKRELRPAEKIQQRRLRTIMAMAADHVILHKRLVMVMNERMHKNSIACNTTIGLPIFHGGSNHIAGHLGKHPNGYGFDIKAMDASVSLYEYEFLTRFRHAMLDGSKDDHVRLETIYQLLYMHPQVMPDGNCFLKGTDGTAGNSSGQACTAHDNTWVNIARFKYCWMWLTGKDVDELDRNVSYLIVGDDGDYTTSDEYKEVFSVSQLAYAMFYNFGVEMEVETEEARPWHDVTFLSMKFRYDSELGQWGTQLDTGRLISSLLQGGMTDALDGSGVTPSKQLQRISSLLISAWCDPGQRSWLRDLLSWYVSVHEPKYRHTPAWIEAKKSMLSDRVCEFIHYGLQAGGLPEDEVWAAIPPQTIQTIAGTTSTQVFLDDQLQNYFGG